ncbi:chemokine XC receptor 1-like [Xiphophorus couchianus]|uniref:chemokine XC receptor 1-like n=1 Tax=Xiphophorus couchianus TaxID=32473 RepID=UPI001016D204|nr:chemokine XC receptor 1-like [Xiphophorus couchianus]
MASYEYFMEHKTESPFDYFTGDYEDQKCNQANVIEFGATLTVSFFSFVILFSLFGNILVLVILFKYENVKSITNTLILNLAVSDLFFTLGLPFWAYYYMYGWTFGEPACQVVNFIFYVGFYSSGFFLILMTIHRYIAVINPLSSIVSTTGPSVILTSFIVWVASILAASPVFIYIKVKDDDSSSQTFKKYCGYEDSYSSKLGIYEQIALFVLTAFVFVFCYSQIMYRLLHPTAQRRRNKTVKLIFVLMVVFFLGWGPYNVIIFLRSLAYGNPPTASHDFEIKVACEKHINMEYAFYITRLLAFSHCCLNPVFYVFAGVKFKTHLKKLLQNFGHRNNSFSHRVSRITITSLTSNELSTYP